MAMITRTIISCSTSTFKNVNKCKSTINSHRLTATIKCQPSTISVRTFAKMLSDPENVGHRQNHVNFDTLGTWDNRIDFPMLLKESIKSGKPIPKITTDNIGVSTSVGRRSYNEDRHVVKEIVSNILYFGIFDGHGGHLCSQFVAQNLENFIKYWISNGISDLEVVLENSFVDVNNAFARFVTYNHSGRSEALSGTTATVCLLRNSHELAVAHVGDSRALICRNGEAMRLTEDHSAHHVLEKERIIKSGGNIELDSVGRALVNKRLAMTRSIGDLDLKPFGVTCQPDTKSLEIKHGKDSCLILTTDGINYVMTDREVINAVVSSGNPTESANLVIDQALNYACEDNATIIVVPFGSWGKFRNNSTNRINSYSFGRELSKSARHS